MNVPGSVSMNVTILQRSVARIDRPRVQTGVTPEHRVRPLIPSGDPNGTDPFLLLMQDWLSHGVFDRHFHTGHRDCYLCNGWEADHYDNDGQPGLTIAGECNG